MRPRRKPKAEFSAIRTFPLASLVEKSCFYFHISARVAQLVEHNLPKVGVAGSSPVSRLKKETIQMDNVNLIALTKWMVFSYSLSALFFFLLMYIRESAN